MLPLIHKFVFDTDFSKGVLYLFALGLVASAVRSGWRGATGALDPKTGKFAEPTRDERKNRALSYGLFGVALAGVGLYWALPYVPIIGPGKNEGLPIHTYGVLVGSGFIAAVTVCGWLAVREWPGEEGIKRRDQIFDLAFYVFVGAMMGSRDLFIAVNWKQYLTEQKNAEAWAMVLDMVVLVGLVGAGVFRQRFFPTPAAQQRFFDRAFIIFVATFLGGRVLFSMMIGKGGLTAVTDMFGGGLVFYGGLIGASITALWYAIKEKVDFMRLADIAMPTVSLGQALGRLGCFSAGCCWGDVTTEAAKTAVQFPGLGAKDLFGFTGGTPSLAWNSMSTDTRWVVEATGKVSAGEVPGAVRISEWVTQHGHTLPIHPTQLYESLGQMVLFVGLLTLRRYRLFHGQITAVWLMSYALLRSTVELFRGDLERGTLRHLLNALDLTGLAASFPLEAWYNISISQFLSFCMFSLGATLLARGLRARRAHPVVDLNALAVG